MMRRPFQLSAEQECVPLWGLVHFNHQHSGRNSAAHKPASQAECKLIHAKRGGSSYQRRTSDCFSTQAVSLTGTCRHRLARNTSPSLEAVRTCPGTMRWVTQTNGP